MTDDRIIAIETRIAFYEKTVEELSAIVYKQQKEIEFLRLELNDLKNFAASQNFVLKDIKDETLPPHY
ncbi:MAG: SlyX family protein [Chitinispirillales bacterium]|jgi:uncharacterized coiled-coil protein SlyX|nr:SlyX family protein [Chitinispirillales bacterium]